MAMLNNQMVWRFMVGVYEPQITWEYCWAPKTGFAMEIFFVGNFPGKCTGTEELKLLGGLKCDQTYPLVN